MVPDVTQNAVVRTRSSAFLLAAGLLALSALASPDSARQEQAEQLLDRLAQERVLAREMALQEIEAQWQTARELAEAGRHEDARQALQALQKTIRESPEPEAFAKMKALCEKELEKTLAGLKKQQAKREAEIRTQAREILERERRKAVKVREQEVAGVMREAQRAYDAADHGACSRLCGRALVLDPGNASANGLKMLALRESYRDRLARVERNKTRGREDLLVATTEAATPLKSGQVLAYPSEEKWRRITEARRKKEPARKPLKPWEIEIRDKLKKPVTAQFDRTPLQDVLQFIGSTTDVNIVFDRSAARDADEPVTLQVNKMTAKSTLEWVLKMAELEYAIMNEAIFVTSRKRLEEMAPEELRFYDFEDLLRARARDFGAAGREGADLVGKEEAATDWIDFLRKALDTGSKGKGGEEKGLE